MVRKPTRLSLMSACAAATLAAGAALWAASTTVPQVTARTAEVWVLHGNVDPSAVLLADKLLYVSLPDTHTVVAFERDGHVHGQLSYAQPVLAAAFDAARGLVYMTSPTRPGIRVIEAGSVKLIRHVALPHAYTWMTVADGAGFANASAEPTVDVIDLDSLAVTASVAVSGCPLRSVRAGNKLYVSSGKMVSETEWKVVPGKIDVVDLGTCRVIKTLTLPGAYPSALAWDGGRYLYVAPLERGNLVRIDTTRDELDSGFNVEIDGRPYDIVLDTERNLAYLSCTGVEGHLSVVCLKAREEIATVWAGEGYMAFERQPNGSVSRLWVPNINCHLITVLDPAKLFAD